jgi:hypothetical protein
MKLQSQGVGVGIGRGETQPEWTVDAGTGQTSLSRAI